MLFKRPHDFFTPPPKRVHCILEQSTPPPGGVKQSMATCVKNSGTLVDLSSHVLLEAMQTTRILVPDLRAHIEILKREVQALQTQPQQL